MEIRKKCWPEMFQRLSNSKKSTDVRLADFELNEGDVIVFEEYSPLTKEYTGKVLKKTVTNIKKIKVTDFNSIEDITKHGHYVIELE
ncbi:DUF3850 domain-containing protein [Candidatus Pacearchaeota archaeon]|nr:DUF3850 domain-containing protein [Candidatus Pacearchaeota archaeon]